ncbi:GlxA family transcriptional regulator [Aquisphaera giovannonii]|uniref:GlxA family transcriptional regulator n=1 Tax=Aquisphaera giovannonii TaxID=406548 RepID=UPI001FE7818B|nr:DJ-1/PfpI family protein [Aquisphaera giovannonii]
MASERRAGARGRGGRRVVLLAYPGADLLDVAGPCAVFDAFGHAPDGAREGTAPGYRLEVVSAGGGTRVETSCRVALVAGRDYRSIRGTVDTLLVAGGEGAWRAARDEPLLRWLRRMAPRVRRIGSVCTGAFVLAAAGLLDGRRATTHWELCPRLARDHPAVAVEEEPIFVRDGNVYTSAGVTAGMDLALAMVEEDHGHDAAMRIARHLVMFVRRPGGQPQFSAALDLQAAERRPIRELQAWIAGHPSGDLSVGALAARVHMSPRNFARVFRDEVGQTPARFVERVRVEAARRLLEESAAGLDRVARECGFGGPDSMRRSFLRVLRVAPSKYRGRLLPGPVRSA